MVALSPGVAGSAWGASNGTVAVGYSEFGEGEAFVWTEDGSFGLEYLGSPFRDCGRPRVSISRAGLLGGQPQSRPMGRPDPSTDRHHRLGLLRSDGPFASLTLFAWKLEWRPVPRRDPT